MSGELKISLQHNHKEMCLEVEVPMHLEVDLYLKDMENIRINNQEHQSAQGLRLMSGHNIIHGEIR